MPIPYPHTLQEEEEEAEEEADRVRKKTRTKTVLKPSPGKLGRLGWHRSTIPGVSLSLLISADAIHVNSLSVHPNTRGQGIGTQVMLDVLSLAYRQRKPVTLTPMADYPEHQARLVRWYRRLGFVRRVGGMVRYPGTLKRLNASPAKPQGRPRSLLGDGGKAGL